MSAGLGSVRAAQTYLDISQGNRVFDSLYDSDLPGHVEGGICGPGYSKAVVERAESAPAEIVPGLLATTLAEHGRACEVRSLKLGELGALIGRLRGNDMVVAIGRAPPAKNGALAIGVAGRGFNGDLTSDSTRTNGYVLSTDIAPTILSRLGIAVPSQMSGQAIRSEGSVDPAAIESLAARMAVISERRGPVIGVSLLVWLVVFGLAALVSSDRVGRVAIRLAGLSIVYLPLLLLAAAALEPGQDTEQILVMFGAPLLAALTLFLLGGLRALAVASGLVVGALAIDVIAGSPLTSLSLLGPNPGLGVRFYGIGNELEALLGVLVVAGTGAALAGFWPRLTERRAAAAFLAVSLLSAIVFAAGRFGADVGAAIVLPVGGAVAAAAIGARRRRTALLVIAAPIAVLALIALADLVTGANAHLTRSVLDAGGLSDLADVAQRRLQLSAHSFARPIVIFFLPLIAALAALAIWQRARLRKWLQPAPALRAGLIGAVAATVIGTLANDSGALLLEIGTAYVLVFAAYAWCERSA
ncbi:MAG TPA: hypothetical protein VH042_02570 [Solirubrobacterales bacterium]|jgi:hypothetical protein|nr:hypothetical protein [Solirubrobacterales bacterium]